MIHLVEKCPGFMTYWHVPPPARYAVFVVTREEWTERNNRHIYAWRYPELPVPDEQGWRAVPGWWRSMP